MTLPFGEGLRPPHFLCAHLSARCKKVLDKQPAMVYKDFKQIKQTLDAEVKLQAHPQRVPHS